MLDKYLINQMVEALDREQLRQLKTLLSPPEGLSRAQFVNAWKSILKPLQYRSITVVMIQDLFAQVDTSNSGRVNWEDFSEHLISCSGVKSTMVPSYDETPVILRSEQMKVDHLKYMKGMKF
jgi:hypothetical protein